MIRTKTPEQIKKVNLDRTLGRLKTKVADAEEVWLGMFGDIMPLLMEKDTGGMDRTLEWLTKQVRLSSLLADVALEEWEGRWGK